jgi:hypothetical protein
MSDRDISTYPPEFQAFIGILFRYEDYLSDGYGYYCGSRYRETMIAIAKQMQLAARQLPEVRTLLTVAAEAAEHINMCNDELIVPYVLMADKLAAAIADVEDTDA